MDSRSRSFEVNEDSRVADFAWLVGSFAKLHRLPFDPALLLHRFPPPYELSTLIASLESVGCKVEQRRTKRINDIQGLAIPYVAFLRCPPQVDPSLASAPPDPRAANSSGDEGGSGLSRAVLVAKSDGERMLYFRVGSDVPQFIDTKSFFEHFEPLVLTVGAVRREASVIDATSDDSSIANTDQVRRAHAPSAFVGSCLNCSSIGGSGAMC